MNKIAAAAIMAALLSVPFASEGANTETESKQDLAVLSETVEPVDLTAASAAYDVQLPPQPIRMTADSMVMRNSDGYVKSRGNVDVQQGMDEIHAPVVEGNTQSQVYYVPGPAVYLSGENAMIAKGITYHSDKQGTMIQTIDGFMGPNYYIRGEGAEMVDGVGYVKHGLITTPHAVAKTPDYYLTGDDIRIYPGEKFTVENTKLWFKHVCLLTYGHYEGRLDDDASKSILFTLFPRPFFNSDDGIGLKGRGSFPLNGKDDLKLNVNYVISSQNGLKPAAQVEKNTSFGTFRLGYSTEESTDNDSNVWATKWPELEYFAPRLYLGQSGIYADTSASWGRWAEDGVETGTHKGLRVEVSHQPISLWKNANLRFFGGYRRDWYSTQNAQRKDPYYGAILNQGINDRMWVSLWYKKHNISGFTPYRFDTLDDPRQQGFSVGYVLTPLDTVIFTLAQDLDTHDVTDKNYTWVRDLHSFMAAITYKEVDSTWEVKLTAKDLDF